MEQMKKGKKTKSRFEKRLFVPRTGLEPAQACAH